MLAGPRSDGDGPCHSYSCSHGNGNGGWTEAATGVVRIVDVAPAVMRELVRPYLGPI